MAEITYNVTVTENVISVVSVGVQGPPGPAGTGGGDVLYQEQLVDYLSETTLYRAEAENAGADPASAVWRIRHITINGSGTSATTLWASGTEDFNKVWDNRASYSYS